MGFWSGVLRGRPDPVFGTALEAGAEDSGPTAVSFAVDAESYPPSVTGLASYASVTAAAPRVSRREAVQVAAVKRARDLIAGSLGTLPLVTVKSDLTVDASSWLTQPERDVPRSVTMTRTIEDLLYEGIAWWKITSFDWRGYPAQVVRLDPRTVDVLKDGRVHVTLDGHRGMADQWPSDDELIRFDSPNDALLVAGARAIRQCLSLDTAAQRYADGAPPLDYFTPADGVDPADDEEVIAILDAWQAARQARATGYVPAALKYNLGGWNPEQLQLAEARQHAVLEIARVAGVDPEDLGVSTTSRTYANQFDRRKAFLDFTLGAYRAAVEDRLSMGDVTPRGTVTRFDLDSFLRSDAKTRYEAAKLGLEVGALTRAEVRADERRPALPAGQKTPTPDSTQGEPVSATQLHTAQAQTFDDHEGDLVTFEAPNAPEAFSVDVEKRTIRGLAVPYGVVSNDGRTYQFSKGSIQYGDPGRIKLLVAHNWGQAIGKATALEETDAGLLATFKVARGAEGDRALSMAEDGVWDGLSVGIGKGMKTQLKDGVQHVVSAPLREISQTPCPAYDGARITEVAASAHHERGTHMECTKCGKVHAPGVSDCIAADVAAFEAAQSADGQNFTAVIDAIKDGFASLTAPQRQTVSAGRPPAAEVVEPLPYRFDGLPGEHGFLDDMRAAQFGDAEARQRLDEFGQEAFAVTSTNTGSLNPTQNRPELYVPNLSYSRPLWESVSTGGIDDKTPFTVPKFASATGLVGEHTEGVEPTPGAFSATSQTVTPTAISGKVEINREVLDQGGSPQADAIIWGEMLNAWYEALEARIADTLAAVATAELNLADATDDALVDAMTNYFAGLQFVRGGNRYTGLILDGQLFPALVNAKDSTGRKLLPVLNPANAQGQVSGAFDRVQIGNQTGRAAWALGAGAAAKSYSFVPSSVWAWASAPKRFLFEYQVKSVDLAIWGYGASAVLRDSDVKPIDYTTADV